jgi:hypothetical protein
MNISLKILSIVLLIMPACHVIFASRAEAYIDPGTSGVVFSSLAYILAAAAAGLGVILYPIRKIVKRLKGRSTLQVKSSLDSSPASKP